MTHAGGSEGTSTQFRACVHVCVGCACAGLPEFDESLQFDESLGNQELWNSLFTNGCCATVAGYVQERLVFRPPSVFEMRTQAAVLHRLQQRLCQLTRTFAAGVPRWPFAPPRRRAPLPWSAAALSTAAVLLPSTRMMPTQPPTWYPGHVPPAHCPLPAFPCLHLRFHPPPAQTDTSVLPLQQWPNNPDSVDAPPQACAAPQQAAMHLLSAGGTGGAGGRAAGDGELVIRSPYPLHLAHVALAAKSRGLRVMAYSNRRHSTPIAANADTVSCPQNPSTAQAKRTQGCSGERLLAVMSAGPSGRSSRACALVSPCRYECVRIGYAGLNRPTRNAVAG